MTQPIQVEPKAPGALCHECPLYDEPMVPSHNLENASLIICGEAPGANEVTIGKPFIGKAGQLLRRVLEHYGVEEDTVGYTNTCLCRPPGNRTPKTAEVRACSGRLRRELGEVTATQVVATGAVAAKALLASRESITNLRLAGPQPNPDDPTVTIIPTYHPAAALRNPDLLPSIFSDLRCLEVLRPSDSRPATITYQPTDYRVYEDSSSARDAAVQLSRRPIVAIDIETNYPYSDDITCIGVSDGPGSASVFTDSALRGHEAQAAISELLVRPAGIYHNGKFDIQHLWRINPRTKVTHDTMLLHYVLDERKGTHGLEQVASEYVNAPHWKQETKKHLPKANAPLADLPRDILYKYNAYDTDLTFRLYEHLFHRVQQEGLERPYKELLVPGANALARMENYGVTVDVENLEGLEDEFVFALSKIEEKFREWEVNPRSPAQVKVALAKLGFNVASTDKQTLSTIDHDFATTMLDYRARHKLLTTYIQGILKRIRDGKVYPDYLLHGTESGRLSCRNPNLQNIPRESIIRDIFVAPKGKLLLQADYSNLELRLAAAFSKDPWLTAAYRDGRNPHKEAAKAMFGEDYTKEQYNATKTVNFGMLYGESAGHLAGRLGIQKYEAQKMINAFFKRSPNLLNYRKEVRDAIDNHGELTSIFGRKRRFWLVTDDNAYDIYKEGYNFPLQSAASDFTLLSLIRLSEVLDFEVCRPVITVHDSIIFEVEPTALDEVKRTITKVMEQEYDGVPLTIEFAVGERWGSLDEQ